MNDDEIPTPTTGNNSDTASSKQPQRRTRAELDGMVETMWGQIQAQQAQLDRLRKSVAALEADGNETTGSAARWLPFPPPPAAEDKAHRNELPLFTIAHFVQYYNETYVGKPGTRAVAIPDCWLEHPGLIAELATLTYTWRGAHLGKHATVRDAQYWHDRWRPAFAERLATEWVHGHCLTDGHKPAGAPSRTDRYTLEWRATDTPPPRGANAPDLSHADSEREHRYTDGSGSGRAASHRHVNERMTDNTDGENDDQIRH